MAQLSQIKNRISTIQKTQTITKAMRMIAMSFYSRLEKQRAMLNTYRAATKTLTSLLHQEQAVIPAAYRAGAEVPKPQHLIIVCSSAKGLCGGLNNNIIRFFERSLIATKSVKPSFITIGGKACAYLQSGQHGTVVDQIPEYNLNSLDKLTNTIVNHILNKEKPYTAVTIYYTHLKNFFIQTPHKEQLLPFPPEVEGEEKPVIEPLKDSEKYLWEQSPERLGAALIRQYLYTEVIFALFSNLISENAARFIAMDQSTNNAHKYLEALHLAYNKSRQNIITREIAELSGSFD